MRRLFFAHIIDGAYRKPNFGLSATDYLLPLHMIHLSAEISTINWGSILDPLNGSLPLGARGHHTPLSLKYFNLHLSNHFHLAKAKWQFSREGYERPGLSRSVGREY